MFNFVLLSIAGYFVLVYFYLKHLTKKYLLNIANPESVNSGSLHSNQAVRDEYASRETLNILVLTGGGVRGLIPLQVLAKIEEITGKKTGELFDFMAGTSTGAINCSILAIPDSGDGFRYSASDILRDYVKNIRLMFSAPLYHQLLTLFGLFGPRYLPAGKLSVLRSYLADYTLADLRIKLIVPVYDLAENALRVIRNWEPVVSGQHSNYSLCDLIHGASNPPMMFSPRAFMVADKKKVFIDPGMIVNNPAHIALLNAWFMFPKKKIRIVLIGNGGTDAEHYGHSHMAEFGAYGLLQYLLNSPVISSKFSTDLVNEYIHEASDYGLDVDFCYINAEGGKELATANTSNNNMAKIQKFADKLLQQNEPQILNLATKLAIDHKAKTFPAYS